MEYLINAVLEAPFAKVAQSIAFSAYFEKALAKAMQPTIRLAKREAELFGGGAKP
jgi:hypothetical protein